MEWIKSNFRYLYNRQLPVADIDTEHQKALDLIRNFQPIGDQFVYALSYLNDRIIYLSEGTEKVFGYLPEEINGLDFFYDRIHPDDLDMVKKLTLKSISIGSGKYRLEPNKQIFHILFRMKNKSGNYIKVQRQTGLLTKDANHDMLTSFGIFTNVSHLTNAEKVQAYMTGPDVPDFRFSHEPEKSRPRFTRREKEIINLLAKGYNSKRIGLKLFISIETVNTHRKNVLQKAKVKNSTELMAYVFKNGF